MTKEFNDDRSGDPGRREMALARSLPLLIFVILAMAVVALLAFRNFGALRTTATIYDQARGICTGQPVAGAGAYDPDAAGIHPVVVFVISSNGLIQSNQTFIRDEWAATGVGDLELALCLENQRQAIRAVCENSALSNPVGQEIEATLYEAATGQIVAEAILGSNPLAAADCLEELPDEVDLSQEFPPEPIIEWLEPFVTN